jgi:hypothetical protein
LSLALYALIPVLYILPGRLDLHWGMRGQEKSKRAEAKKHENPLVRKAPYCVLAFDTDTGPAGTTGTIGVTTYIGGSFLRHTIETASGFGLSPELLAYLRSMHIFVERPVG